jgi:RimJ/RimL family protein N-acetyltransferase
VDIRLESFGRQDFASLISWVESSAFLMQWAGPLFVFPLDEKQLEAYLAEAEKEEPSRFIFKAVDIATGEAVGHIELDKVDRVHRSAVISRVLVAPGHRGNGIGTKMVEKAVRFGFEELGLHRLELRVFDFNRAAIQCYEKVGFRQEGVLREARRVGNVWWSLVCMSLLEHEWREKNYGEER